MASTVTNTSTLGTPVLSETLLTRSAFLIIKNLNDYEIVKLKKADAKVRFFRENSKRGKINFRRTVHRTRPGGKDFVGGRNQSPGGKTPIKGSNAAYLAESPDTSAWNRTLLFFFFFFLKASAAPCVACPVLYWAGHPARRAQPVETRARIVAKARILIGFQWIIMTKSLVQQTWMNVDLLCQTQKCPRSTGFDRFFLNFFGEGMPQLGIAFIFVEFNL
jgi:hypothetical protein